VASCIIIEEKGILFGRKGDGVGVEASGIEDSM
jgi:hypothetical protein